jgi:transcriptional regulator
MYTQSLQKSNQKKSKNFCKRIAPILINQTNGKLCATHIQLGTDYNEELTLYGHISKRKSTMEWFMVTTKF